MQPAKRQKLEVDVREDAQVVANSAHHAAPSLSQACLEQAVPEPSGNTEASLTEFELISRRKHYLQRLSSLYQAQSQDSQAGSDQLEDGHTNPSQRCSASLLTVLPHVSRYEQIAAAATNRELDAKHALAMLCGKHTKFLVTSTAVDLGRSTATQGKVNVDLAEEGDAKKVSRKQAHLQLNANGKFTLANTGRRTIFVNGAELVQHAVISLEHLSLIDLAGIHLLFMINQSAVRRLVSRSQNLVL